MTLCTIRQRWYWEAKVKRHCWRFISRGVPASLYSRARLVSIGGEVTEPRLKQERPFPPIVQTVPLTLCYSDCLVYYAGYDSFERMTHTFLACKHCRSSRQLQTSRRYHHCHGQRYHVCPRDIHLERKISPATSGLVLLQIAERICRKPFPKLPRVTLQRKLSIV